MSSLFIIFMIFALIGGVILQLLFRRLPVSIALPTVVLSLLDVFISIMETKDVSAILAPLWRILLFFVIVNSAVLAVAASVGALLVAAVTKMRKSK